MNKRIGEINIHDTTLMVWEDHVDEDDLFSVYSAMIRHLRGRGFRVRLCPHIKKNYPILSKHHHYGKKGNLEVSISMSGRTLKAIFYQNLVFDNSSGGRYDFQRYHKMSYLLRQSYILEVIKLSSLLVSNYGYATKADGLLAVRDAARGWGPKTPLEDFNKRWNKDRFTRDADGWPTPKELDNGMSSDLDREGVRLHPGTVRWFRGRDGRVRRGKVYPNMNSMWGIYFGPGHTDRTWRHSSDFFTPQPGENLQRQMGSTREKALEKELAKAIEAQAFERAAVLRDTIKADIIKAAACGVICKTREEADDVFKKRIKAAIS